MKRVTVFEDYHYNMPDTFAEFIELMNSKMESIPEEFRSSALIDFTADDYSTEIWVWYSRDETAEEVAENARQYKLRLIAEQEAERIMYQRLKSKFEGDA